MIVSLRPALPLALVAIAVMASSAISMAVAGERTQLERLRVGIARDARDIRILQAELRTRARLPELQRWNDEVFGFATPVAGQYLADPVQLASYRNAPDAPPAVVYAVTEPAPVVPSGPVRQVAYTPPATPVRVAAGDLGGIGTAIDAAAQRERVELAPGLR